jgi:hypothetical protein
MAPAEWGDPSTDELADAAATGAVQAKQAAATAGAVGRLARHEVETLRENARPAPAPDPRHGPLHVPPELLSEEAASRLRLGPRKNRWPQLEALETKVVELEQRSSALLTEVQELTARRDEEERTYPERLAGWLANPNPRGPRPVSSVEHLDNAINERRAEHEAVRILREQALKERVRFVERNRKNLVRDAERATERVKTQILEHVGEIERLRSELLDCAASWRWAQLYPGELTDASVGFETMIAIGLAKPLKQTIGTTAQVPAGAVFELLRLDCEIAAQRLSPAQRRELGVAAPSPEEQAMWFTSEEYAVYAREQARKLRERQEWMSRDQLSQAVDTVSGDRPG